jgi:mono/diheme cytochrome c family protein
MAHQPRSVISRPAWGAVAITVVLAGAMGRLEAVADQPSARAIDFAQQVRPILEKHCYACHGPEKRKGGLRLDLRDAALAGGDSGPILVPGHPAESLLIEKVTAADPAEAMPPEGDRLTDDEIGRLRSWIDAGAVWPIEEDSTGTSQPSHWSFVAPRRPELPPVRGADWVRNPVDRFVLARLERENVQPSPEADRRTLIRRLSLDLLGLLPAPEDVDAFVHDSSPVAYEKLVDRLLASPHFGERWGRHWLDLARYADSDGYEKDSPRPFAYRYRDWLIDAINRDMPFDRFTIEQLAGDLLPGATIDQRIATGFHRNTLTNKEGGVDQEEFRVAAVIDRTNTTGTVWLGLTIGCAQCHSHKYDPITQREYYGLFAFFNNGRELDLPTPGPGEQEAYLDELARFDAGEITKLPTPPALKAPILVEMSPPRTTRLLVRGDFLRPGDEVRAGTPAILPPIRSEGEAPSRLELARWLVDPANPLPARVEMNRVWSHLFGRPLVATVDDYGTRGQPPSHPALLDWLATELVQQGWSRKAMIQLIVTSAAYRQSSAVRPELLDRDPSNGWLSRQNRFRPEAEVVRDLFLSAAGLLTPRIGGPSVRPPQPPGISELTYANSAKWVESTGPDRFRRGVYTWFQRTSPYPTLTTFDAPDANVCAARRERSNTPLQALTLLNDRAFVECARGLARRVNDGHSSDDAGRVSRMFETALSRPPTADECSVLLGLLANLREECRREPERAARLAGVADSANVDVADAAAWVALARTVLNLDEFVTRE